MLGTIKTIAAEEGPRALFKGVAPRVLQLGLNHAIRFTGYQVLSSSSYDMHVSSSSSLIDHQ